MKRVYKIASLACLVLTGCGPGDAPSPVAGPATGSSSERAVIGAGPAARASENETVLATGQGDTRSSTRQGDTAQVPEKATVPAGPLPARRSSSGAAGSVHGTSVTSAGPAAVPAVGDVGRAVGRDFLTGHGLALLEPDGGANFWEQYGHPAGFLPLGVYFQAVSSSSDVTLDKAAGFNVYLGTDHAYDDMGLLAANDMWAWMFSAGQGGALSDYETWKDNPRVTGWMLTDERDMLGDDDVAAQQGLESLAGERATIPDDGRLVYANFGKGVGFWHPDSFVERFVNEYSDVSSGDVYWHSGPELMNYWQAGSFLRDTATEHATEAEVRLSANYGLYVDKMRRLSSGPVLNFIEAAPLGHWGLIGAEEQRAAAWHSLFAGARGLAYFATEFDDDRFIEQSAHRENAEVRARLGRLNAEIASYASVLNSSDVTGLVVHGSTVRSLSKWDGNEYTVFTGSMQQKSQSVPIAVNVPARSVEVLGENRVLPIIGGAFTDTFADGNAVHIYRLVF